MIHVNKLDIKIPGVRPRRFLHISDAHTSQYLPDDPPELKEVLERYSWIWGTEGRTANENFDDFLALAKQEKPDLLTIAGDIMDTYSPCIARFLTEKLADFPVEYRLAYGNHDEPSALEAPGLEGPEREAALRAGIIGPGPAFWVKDYGDLLLIGIYDADHTVTEERLALLKEQLDRGIPTLMVMHIPLPLPGFAERIIETYEDHPYYLLGHANPNERADRFYAMLTAPDSPVRGILAGHVHLVSKTEYAPGRVQITAAPGYGWDVTVNGGRA